MLCSKKLPSFYIWHRNFGNHSVDTETKICLFRGVLFSLIQQLAYLLGKGCCLLNFCFIPWKIFKPVWRKSDLHLLPLFGTLVIVSMPVLGTGFWAPGRCPRWTTNHVPVSCLLKDKREMIIMFPSYQLSSTFLYRTLPAFCCGSMLFRHHYSWCELSHQALDGWYAQPCPPSVCLTDSLPRYLKARLYSCWICLLKPSIWPI